MRATSVTWLSWALATMPSSLASSSSFQATTTAPDFTSGRLSCWRISEIFAVALLHAGKLQRARRCIETGVEERAIALEAPERTIAAGLQQHGL